MLQCLDFEVGVVDYITAALEEGRAEKLKAKIGRDYITGDDLAGPTRNNDIRKYMYTELQHAADFWENLPWMPNGQKVWAAIAPHNPNIFTTPMGYGSEIGKQAWIDKNLEPLPKKVALLFILAKVSIDIILSYEGSISLIETALSKTNIG